MNIKNTYNVLDKYLTTILFLQLILKMFSSSIIFGKIKELFTLKLKNCSIKNSVLKAKILWLLLYYC
jgi:hypothetical protein